MNDDTLILYYYNDGLGEQQRREIAEALESDSDLAARYAALCRDMELLVDGDVADVPAHVVQRMHDSMDRIARPVLVSAERAPSSFSPFSFAWGAAVTAALAIGIGIGLYLPDEPVEIGQPYGDPFVRGMQVHLQDTRENLVSLPIDTPDDRTQLIQHVIDQNRLFERAAVQNDEQSLARVLRAFEPILLQLATDDIAPDDAAALRAQLTFELNVVLTKLSRDSSNETHTT